MVRFCLLIVVGMTAGNGIAEFLFANFRFRVLVEHFLCVRELNLETRRVSEGQHSLRD